MEYYPAIIKEQRETITQMNLKIRTQNRKGQTKMCTWSKDAWYGN